MVYHISRLACKFGNRFMGFKSASSPFCKTSLGPMCKLKITQSHIILLPNYLIIIHMDMGKMVHGYEKRRRKIMDPIVFGLAMYWVLQI